ncbi:aminoglycoside phosphotransferase [Streptomyces sp. NBC_01197]|uniref:aminoglycoside phosphotransferase n=1 Tax=Streptomyces sp. NBC_01197 TaxID=2903768 RepID=UPI002E160083|nr:aminoglycoside phosphotransferase [Streptomyces sp. NBC_01197]
MPAAPITFYELPAAVRTAIEAETGPIRRIENINTGLNSSLSARAHTTGRTVFLKGLRTGHRWVWTQQREADVNPYVTPLAPRVLFHVIVDGWDVLGFESIVGRHADYAPGSPDLTKVLDVLRDLAALPCPDIELRHAEQRLANYVLHPGEADAFQGDALLHTDWNNHNILIAGHRAHLVDWGWATRGAAWLGPAYWIIWLIAAGHTPTDAEESVTSLPAWSLAPPQAVDAFAHASANLWEEIADAAPDDWATNLLDAARLWQQHRDDRS